MSTLSRREERRKRADSVIITDGSNDSESDQFESQHSDSDADDQEETKTPAIEQVGSSRMRPRRVRVVEEPDDSWNYIGMSLMFELFCSNQYTQDESV